MKRTSQGADRPAGAGAADRQRLLHVLAAATFLIFFQAFMVAPLIPFLARIFATAPTVAGMAVPAYLIPYGVMTLVWGPLSDRLGRRVILLGSMAAFVVLTAATAAMDSVGSFTAARAITAVGASGVVPIALALLGDVFEFRERGRALGWLFGAMAGGMAVGSTAGALLEPVVGWRGLFLGVSGLGSGVLVLLAGRRALLGDRPAGEPRRLRVVARGYVELLSSVRAQRTYAYVLVNAVVHSGIYTWLGLYFLRGYGLGEVGIGLAVLGYGVPGFAFGPVIGRLADRRGRARLIPLGLAVAAGCAALLAAEIPLLVAAVVVGLLSLGYDLTQPLLAGVVTDLSANRGQAMGLNVFTLFVGFGLGSLVFQAALSAWGFTGALTAFATAAALAAGLALPAFAGEGPPGRNDVIAANPADPLVLTVPSGEPVVAVDQGRTK
jgi:predicted MFS family arabinose efflux permease